MADIKISDAAFLAILRENGGLYARTAKAITEQYGIEYSRQAVRQRASDHKEELDDINEEVQDNAEDGLQTLMKADDQRVKLDAVKFYLNTKGKNRGYSTRTEIEHSGALGITWNETKQYEKDREINTDDPVTSTQS